MTEEKAPATFMHIDHSKSAPSKGKEDEPQLEEPAGLPSYCTPENPAGLPSYYTWLTTPCPPYEYKFWQCLLMLALLGFLGAGLVAIGSAIALLYTGFLSV